MDLKLIEIIITIITVRINMYDFHSHIVYGVDDGAKDREMTIEMLKTAVESGTDKIIATPHYVRGRFQVPRDEINAGVRELRALAKENNIGIKIYEGQEVYYSKNILSYYEEGVINTIENTRYMLLEVPIRSFDIEEVLDTLYELQLKGIVIILAHPERYRDFIKEPSLINRFIAEGFLFQLNMGSITGGFGKDVKRTAEIFVKHRVYSVVGSDAHRAEVRTTDMRNGIIELEKIVPGYVEEININSERILEDIKISFGGKRIETKRSLFGLFGRK